MSSIYFFDFLSLPNMHLPFNAAFLKTIQKAYPKDQIIFAASAGHIENLKPYFPNPETIVFQEIAPFDYKNEKAHNPFWNRKAAQKCLAAAKNIVNGQLVRHVIIGGVEAALLRTFRQGWKQNLPQLYYILHGQLGTSFSWRTRNPVFRYFDFQSEFRRGLPEGQKWIALEKGIKQSVSEAFPKVKGSLITLEHPITYSPNAENSTDDGENNDLGEGQAHNHEDKIRIAFLGACTSEKGFDTFLRLAQNCTNRHVEFWAIGSSKKNCALDEYSALTRAPDKQYVSEAQYYHDLKQVDMVMLPFTESYRYISSGSLLDAVAYSKPVMTYRNANNALIVDEYGAFGPDTPSERDMQAYVNGLTKAAFDRDNQAWQPVIARIYKARTPEALAENYRTETSNP